MYQRKKSRIYVREIRKGDEAVRDAFTSLECDVKAHFQDMIHYLSDSEYKDQVRLHGVAIKHLLNAMSDVACWGSEVQCDSMHDTIGRYRKLLESFDLSN